MFYNLISGDLFIIKYEVISIIASTLVYYPIKIRKLIRTGVGGLNLKLIETEKTRTSRINHYEMICYRCDMVTSYIPAISPEAIVHPFYLK